MRIQALFIRAILPATLTMFIGVVPAYAQGTAPVPDAGRDRTVVFNGVDPVTVVLDGTGTIDGDGQQLTDDEPATPFGITWSFVSKPPTSAAALSDNQVIRPSFQIDQVGNYVIQLTANDGTDTVIDTVTISTDNSAPHADAGLDQKVALNDTVILDGSGSTDWDGDVLAYSWSVAGPNGAVSLGDPTAVMPSFDVTQAGDYTATLTVSDGVNTSEADQVLVSTANVPPVSKPNVGEDIAKSLGNGSFRLDAEGTSDQDGDAMTYRWSLLWGPPDALASLADPDTRRAILVIFANSATDGDWVMQLTATDNSASPVSHSKTMLISPRNIIPAADAGADQAVAVGQAVTLDGTGSTDNNGNAITYRWALIHKPAGSNALLDNPDAGRPRFTADVAGTYIAQLIVNDGITDSNPDTVVISTDANLAPVANAGIDFFAQPLNQTIQLDGTGSSDANGDTLTYRWTMLERAVRSAAVLSDPTSPTPTFVADKVGFYVMQLVVSDGITESAPDIIFVSAKGAGGTNDVNLRPVAVAGADASQLNPALVQLDGSASINPNDPEPISMTYRWALIHKPVDSGATLSSTTAINPTYTTDLPGLYVVQLIVNDVVFDSVGDTAVVRLNTPPVADAGLDQSGFVDQVVALDGTSSSDPDLDPLTYAWSFAAKPLGSVAALTGAATATPSFTPDVFGDYEVQLVVDDGVVSSAPDLVTVSMVNRPPVAEAGPDQSVIANTLALLDGSASSDPDRQTLTYAWRFTAKPANSLAVLLNPTTVNPSFTADVDGLYVLDLVVNDGIVDSVLPDTVAVRAGSGVINTPPVLAFAIGAQTVEIGSTLTFTLSATDANGDPVGYFATPLPLPANASLDAVGGVFTFRPDEAQIGVHTITFGASDGLDSDSESVPITVAAPPAGTVTTLTARVLDANDLAAGTETPVVNADVILRAVSPQLGLLGAIVAGPVKTDALGNFSITSIPLNAALIDIDGTVANLASNGAAYMQAYEALTLVADAVNVPAEPYALTRLDGTSATVYTPGVETVVTNTTLNTSVTIAATTTVTNLDGTAFSGAFTISEVPTDEVASLLPPLVYPCSVITFQSEPSRVNFSQVASYTLDNPDNLPPGSIVNIWGIARPDGKFTIVGTGTVSPDGLSIIPSNGLGGTPALFFATPRPPAIALAADMNNDSLNPSLFGTGNVSQAISLPGYTSLSEERTISLVYNSQAADPRPIVAAHTTFLAGQALPPKLFGTLEIGGVAVAGPVYMDTAIAEDAINAPGISTGQAIRQALQFDAGDMPSGVQGYQYVSTAAYNCSKVGQVAQGRAIVNNQQDSAFGAGWTMPGLERLDVQADGSVLLSEGDGTAKVFDIDAPGLFFDPLGYPASGPAAGVADDLNGDGHLDMAIPTFRTGEIVLLFGDGSGAFPISRNLEVGGGSTFDVHALDTGDFNNDDIRDLVVNNQLSDRVRVYLGAGDGFYGAAIDISLDSAQGLSVADFDLDGNDDIAVATAAPEDNTSTGHRAAVFFGDGAGGFPRVANFDLGTNNIVVEIADFDNNGAPDVAVAGASGNRIDVLLSDGAGGFPATANTVVNPIRFASSRYPFAAADFDGDGNQDLVLTVQGQGFVTVHYGDGTGGFPVSGNVPIDPVNLENPDPNFEANSVRSVDYNLDGNMDIVTSGRFRGEINLLAGDGARGFSRGPTVPVSSVGGVCAFLTADFNDDTAPDLGVSACNDNRVFSFVADDGFRSPGADFSKLTQNADGTWIRRMTDGTTVEYNADGKMTARVDENGNRTEYTYTGSLLTGISDPADPARSTTFDYTGGNLSGVVEPSGRSTFFVVDANGDLVKMTDAGGNEWRYAYDENSKMSAFASARGFVTSFDYGFAGQYLGTNNPDGTSITASIAGDLGLTDLESAFGTETTPEPSVAPEDRIATLQDAKGNLYEMEVNEYGALIRVTDPIGRTTRIERDGNNLPFRVTKDNDGQLPDGTIPATVVTEMDYDTRGNTVAKREAVGTVLARTTRFEYEPEFNRTIKVIDPSNTDPAPVCATATAPSPGVTCMTYDPANGDLLKITDARGGEQSFTYDARGLRETAVDANLNKTIFAYDLLLGNIETSTNGAGDVTKMLRNAAGEVEGLTEGFDTAVARTTSFVFDDLGRVTRETDPEGGITETVYDAAGNAIEEIDATGIARTSTYDSMDRLADETHPATGMVQRTYDENGNLASMIDPLGNIAHFRYDGVNRADRTEDPETGVRLFAYDLADNPKTVTDANGNATTFKYDVHGREVERSNLLGDTWRFAYDSRDNMRETVDAAGQTIRKTFDELSRLTQMELVEADGLTVEDTVTFGYDAMGQKTSAVDGDSALSWSYDGANRVETASTVADVFTVQPAVVLTHAYDAVGNRTDLTHGPDALAVDGAWGYLHDGNGSLTRVTMPTNENIDLAYDLAKRLERITSGNTVETQVLYDALSGRPDSIAHKLGTTTTLESFDYGFDADGTITSIADAGGTRNFTYDRTQQLKTGGYATAPESYSYDPEGNRTVSHLSASYVHDAANRLREDAETCYAYDANGNLTSKRVKVGLDCVTDITGATTTYNWDILNRLTRIDNPDATYAAYRYDAQGRRIEKDVNNLSLTRYVYDDDAILLEYDGANALLATYSHGEEIDQPLAMTRGVDSWFYHTDHLGSVRLLTNAGGTVVNNYDYDAFGNLEATSFEGIANPYTFTARERDAESGLMFYRARYYDPKIGRFISEDPIGFEANDLNLYRYVFNSPLTAVDPFGETIVGDVALYTMMFSAIGAVAGAIHGALTSENPFCGGLAGLVGGFQKGAAAGAGHGLAGLFGSIAMLLADIWIGIDLGREVADNCEILV